MPEVNQKKIINKLLSKYDKSILSLGENKRKIQISLDVNDKTFPKYIHPESLDEIEAFEKDFKALEKLKIVLLEESGGKISKVSLIIEEEALKKARRFVGSINPQTEAERYQKVFERYINDDDKTVAAFATKMHDKLFDHRKLNAVKKYFSDDKTLKEIIQGIKAADALEEEIRERNLSISLYSDSKRLVNISSKINKILKEFSDIEFNEKPSPIEQLGVVHNPSFALVKNGIIVKLGNQTLDLSKFVYPMPLFDQAIKELEVVRIYATKLITIENLTTFYDFEDRNAIIIYLGGFHNKIRKLLLQKIYKTNPRLICYHWGDIDAGGFYIFNHLVNDTAIPFMPMNMGMDELKKYKSLCKPLTDNDVHRLSIQKEEASLSILYPVIDYMIKNNSKLEQEAFSAFDNKNIVR